MSRPVTAFPEMLSTELHFPEAEQESAGIPEERLQTLSRQAFVLEFAANSVLATYNPKEMGEELWIAHQAPLLARHNEGPIPAEQVTLAETRTVMAQEFNERIATGAVSETDHARILEGLLAYESTVVARAVADALATIHEAGSVHVAPGYLTAGNNASAVVMRDFPGIDGDAVLKVGHPNIDELSGCERAAFTNLRRWLGLMAGKGVDGFEQPVAFSAEQPITISKFVSGVELYEIGKKRNKPQPSEEALENFANAYYESIIRNITIDIHSRDFMYDEATDDLTIIDHVAPSRTYTRRPANYIETTDEIVAVFKASFGYEFDEVAFERLLSEFAKQGLHDLEAQV